MKNTIADLLGKFKSLPTGTRVAILVFGGLIGVALLIGVFKNIVGMLHGSGSAAPAPIIGQAGQSLPANPTVAANTIQPAAPVTAQNPTGNNATAPGAVAPNQAQTAPTVASLNSTGSTGNKVSPFRPTHAVNDLFMRPGFLLRTLSMHNGTGFSEISSGPVEAISFSGDNAHTTGDTDGRRPFMATLTGYVQIPTAGTYTFSDKAVTRDAQTVSLYLNDTEIIPESAKSRAIGQENMPTENSSGSALIYLNPGFYKVELRGTSTEGYGVNNGAGRDLMKLNVYLKSESDSTLATFTPYLYDSKAAAAATVQVPAGAAPVAPVAK